MKEIITKYETELLIEENDDNKELFGMLEDAAVRSGTPEKPMLRVTFENGRKAIRSAGHVGLLKLNDGTQIEIYPKIGESVTDAKRMLGIMMSAYMEIPFETSLAGILESPDSSFMEFFISVFVRESMKILKSGLLSGYTSIEENTSSMQGSIVFSENIRRNLTHRERMYVRHDVFTPDRSENRLIKTAAAAMSKLTRNHQNAQNLKKLMIFLDEVKLSDSIDRDFANCINTRNTKKYSAVLNICRMMLRSKKTGVSGKYVSHGLLFPMDDIFKAYTDKLVKERYRQGLVRIKPASAYLCPDQKLFPMIPELALYGTSNDIRCIVEPRWLNVTAGNAFPKEELYRLCTIAAAYGCFVIVIVCPSAEERSDLYLKAFCGMDLSITIRFLPLGKGSDMPVPFAAADDDPDLDSFIACIDAEDEEPFGQPEQDLSAVMEESPFGQPEQELSDVIKKKNSEPEHKKKVPVPNKHVKIKKTHKK